LEGVLYAYEAIAILFWMIDAVGLVFMAYRFLKRVRRKVDEPMWSHQSKKMFTLWTLMVFVPLMSLSFVCALVILFLTWNVGLSLATFVVWSGCAVFVWLIWAIVPSAQELVRECLER